MSDTTSNKYIESIGKRKTSRARVRMTPASKNSFEINGVTLEKYFGTLDLQSIPKEALSHAGEGKHFMISVRISGGGIHSQAEALRLGIARALLLSDTALKTPLRKAGFLTRDGRIKERRKFGLKKARKAPTWSKR